MASRVGLACDERMGKIHEEDPFLRREEPSRITSIHQRLKSAGIPERVLGVVSNHWGKLVSHSRQVLLMEGGNVRCVQVDARNATINELQTAHDEEYIEKVKRSSSTDVRKWTPDHESPLYVKKGSYESALLATGFVIEVATQVAEGKLEAGACAVRPPGLHAEANTRKGSSIFNHVAVAVKIVVHEKKVLGVRKVLILDWDVHHGNGTQQIFWDDSQVLYISFHRYDDGEFFPKGDEGNFDQVGVGKGLGYNINIPLPHGGFGDADYVAFFKHIVMPVARDFNPDMIFISAGFDSASGDPLGGCNVTPHGYAWMTQQLMGLAEGRVVLALEGGYSSAATPDSFLACVRALLRDPSSFNIPNMCDILQDTFPLIKKVRNELKKYWPVLRTEVDLRAEQEVMHAVPPTHSPNLSAEWPLLQFDIDDGLCVRAPMDERELKKQLPLQALLEEEQGPNDPMEGQQEMETLFLAESPLVPEL